MKTPSKEKRTEGKREFVSNTLKMVLFMAVVSALYGLAYGWGNAWKVWLALSLISVLGQCWAFRKELENYFSGSQTDE